VIELDPGRIASAAGAEVVHRGAGSRPRRTVVDSREIAPGDLFVGLPGASVDGGDFAGFALAAGAWGVLVSPDHAR
jgi:UDP-N-acetylmuramoyl-tripeptide--D-alanyl-D-alanine ligase